MTETEKEIEKWFDAKQFYHFLGSLTKELNERLFCLWYKKTFRYSEQKQNKRPISSNQLNQIFEEFMKNSKNGEPDPFYSPSYLGQSISLSFSQKSLQSALSHDEEPLYFTDKEALLFLPYLTKTRGWEEITMTNITEIRCFLLSLKIALYYSLQDTTPLSNYLERKIVMTLQQISYLTSQTENNFEKEELEREEKELKRQRNQKNALSITPFRINKIKKHKKYPEIERILIDCQGEPSFQQIKELNKLIGEVVITKSRTTIRRYRQLLLQDTK